MFNLLFFLISCFFLPFSTLNNEIFIDSSYTGKETNGSFDAPYKDFIVPFSLITKDNKYNSFTIKSSLSINTVLQLSDHKNVIIIE